MFASLIQGIPGLVHGFGNRQTPIPAQLTTLWAQAKPQWKQTHGVQVARAQSACASLGETDAIWTRERDVPIAVVTADCVPILLAKRDGSAVAAVHAGWRGTRARILRELFATPGLGEPSAWLAAVGPAIGPCCYEVSPELATEFTQTFGAEHGAQVVVPKHRHLDLPAINAAELRVMGLHEVELLRACTRCTLDPNGEPAFHSYRREGGGTRQYSMIAIS